MRPSEMDMVVALNPETYKKDVAAVRPGGYLLYDSSWPLDDSLVREGITILGIPFGKMCVEAFNADRERTPVVGHALMIMGMGVRVCSSHRRRAYRQLFPNTNAA